MSDQWIIGIKRINEVAYRLNESQKLKVYFFRKSVRFFNYSLSILMCDLLSWYILIYLGTCSATFETFTWTFEVIRPFYKSLKLILNSYSILLGLTFRKQWYLFFDFLYAYLFNFSTYRKTVLTDKNPELSHFLVHFKFSNFWICFSLLAALWSRFSFFGVYLHECTNARVLTFQFEFKNR